MDRPIAGALRPVHDAPCVGVEAITPMHHATVVPNNEIPHTPAMDPRKAHLASMGPQLVEQRLRLLDRHVVDVGIRPAAKIEDIVSGFGMRPDDRMAWTFVCSEVGDDSVRAP